MTTTQGFDEPHSYTLPRSIIQARFTGQSVHGKLATERGKPVAGATVTGLIPGIDWSTPTPEVSFVGVVPPKASSALLGVRLNIECRCTGPNDLLLGTIQYQE